MVHCVDVRPNGRTDRQTDRTHNAFAADLYLVTGSEAEVDVCGRNADVLERWRAQDALGPHCRRYRSADVGLPQYTGRTAPSRHAPATSGPRYQPDVVRSRAARYIKDSFWFYFSELV